MSGHVVQLWYVFILFVDSSISSFCSPLVKEHDSVEEKKLTSRKNLSDFESCSEFKTIFSLEI